MQAATISRSRCEQHVHSNEGYYRIINHVIGIGTRFCSSKHFGFTFVWIGFAVLSINPCNLEPRYFRPYLRTDRMALATSRCTWRYRVLSPKMAQDCHNKQPLQRFQRRQHALQDVALWQRGLRIMDQEVCNKTGNTSTSADAPVRLVSARTHRMTNQRNRRLKYQEQRHRASQERHETLSASSNTSLYSSNSRSRSRTTRRWPNELTGQEYLESNNSLFTPSSRSRSRTCRTRRRSPHELTEQERLASNSHCNSCDPWTMTNVSEHHELC